MEIYDKQLELRLENFTLNGGLISRIMLRNGDTYEFDFSGEVVGTDVNGMNIPIPNDDDILDVVTYDVSFSLRQGDFTNLRRDLNILLSNPEILSIFIDSVLFPNNIQNYEFNYLTPITPADAILVEQTGANAIAMRGGINLRIRLYSSAWSDDDFISFLGG